jgi:hypothetical protein
VRRARQTTAPAPNWLEAHILDLARVELLHADISRLEQRLKG